MPPPATMNVCVCLASDLRASAYCPTSNTEWQRFEGDAIPGFCTTHTERKEYAVCRDSLLLVNPTRCLSPVMRALEEEPTEHCGIHPVPTMVSRTVCEDSDLLRNAFCLDTVDKEFESGQEPVRECYVHNASTHTPANFTVAFIGDQDFRPGWREGHHFRLGAYRKDLLEDAGGV